MRFGAGQPVKRLEDHRLLTGKGRFIDDKPEDGALWLHVLRSPHAHAKIVSIDIAAAAGMGGVEAVFTGADLIKVTLDDSAPCRTNPLGAKGCGESGAIGGPPCIANGVMDALSDLGIKQLNTLLTP
jgi:CO/xanthine dehydrogenase Mo-binding subunit